MADLADDRKLRQLVEKYTDIRPVVVDGSPDAHNLFLRVGSQRFCVEPYECTREEAEWLRDQLCAALGKIVRECAEHG